MSKTWDLDEGLKLVRALKEPTLKYGYHLTLGGSVLHTGTSSKDIDLYFLPLNNPKMAKADPETLLEWLASLWGPWEQIGGEYGEDPQPSLDALVNENRARREAAERPFRPGDLRIEQGPLRGAAAVRVDPNAPWRIAEPQVIRAAPAHPVSTVYRYKVKFLRSGGDRIDVFVL